MVDFTSENDSPSPGCNNSISVGSLPVVLLRRSFQRFILSRESAIGGAIIVSILEKIIFGFAKNVSALFASVVEALAIREACLC